MKFTASSEKFLEERIPGVNVPPGHWTGKTKEVCSCLDLSVVYMVALLWR